MNQWSEGLKVTTKQGCNSVPVTAIGFVFHTCLLLVLLLWKPSGDDSALFYVISAAWGVCNAIWETLYFSEF